VGIHNTERIVLEKELVKLCNMLLKRVYQYSKKIIMLRKVECCKVKSVKV